MDSMVSPLVSIITPVLNGEKTIEATVKSVLCQSYANLEYIIVDNGSTDATMDIINNFKGRISQVLFEAEKGIYTTMNRGIKSAKGEIVGILNSDDFYVHKEVIKKIVERMQGEGADSCWADLAYIGRSDINKVIRYWKSSQMPPGSFLKGWMPPHPTFFVRRHIYMKYGFFNPDFKIAADYELMLRFLYRHRISCCYLPEVLVKMRSGGLSNSSLRNLFIKSYEDYRAWKVNNLRGNFYIILLKKLIKMPQFLEAYKKERV